MNKRIILSAILLISLIATSMFSIVIYQGIKNRDEAKKQAIIDEVKEKAIVYIENELPEIDIRNDQRYKLFVADDVPTGWWEIFVIEFTPDELAKDAFVFLISKETGEIYMPHDSPRCFE